MEVGCQAILSRCTGLKVVRPQIVCSPVDVVGQNALMVLGFVVLTLVGEERQQLEGVQRGESSSHVPKYSSRMSQAGSTVLGRDDVTRAPCSHVDQ
jgi:hypothetical protein